MRKIPTQSLQRPSPEEFAAMGKLPVAVVLDNVRSANNVGSFFRTCDAFAVERLILCGITACPPSAEIHKTALGAENTVEWEHYPTTLAAVERLRAEGFRIIAVEQVTDAVQLQDFTPQPGQKYAFIFGNEVAGVDQAVVDACDGAIEIPQAGTKHSLNVAVSGGAVLWQVFSVYINRPK